MEELVERTNDIRPEAVRRAFVNAQGVAIRLKANHMGLTTMRDRNHAIGAELTVTGSGEQNGTAVTVTLDRDR